MAYKIKLEKFEGPMDLLLQLIESADLDITEVAIANVADQFMEYLANIEQKRPEELADFLVTASRLILIKSRVLLPSLHIEQEDEAINLETQLKIYKEYYDASKKIEDILNSKKVLFSREKILSTTQVLFNPPGNLDASKMKSIFLGVIKEIEPVVKAPKKSMLRAVSIKEKIENIRKNIEQGLILNFSDLIKQSKDRTEVVVSFLGVLELVKQRFVIVRQEEMFNEITIEKNND